jgi:hypothetical protein
MFVSNVFYEKYFSYFMVFGGTDNNSPKIFFGLTKKDLFNFHKMISIFKTVNYFSSLSFLFSNCRNSAGPLSKLYRTTVKLC